MEETQTQEKPEELKRKRGRPKGSKNKVKNPEESQQKTKMEGVEA